MAIFGRGFPSKSFAFGAIAAPPVVDMSIEETIDNVGVGTQTLYVQAISEADINSGNAAQALTVEATSEAEVNAATGAQGLGVDATAESTLGTQITDYFSTTGQLDDFNRADENPLSQSSAWDGPIRAGARTDIRLVSNEIARQGSGSTSEAYRTGTSFTDSEAYFTIKALPTDNSAFAIAIVRIQTPLSTNADFYAMELSRIGTGNYSIDAYRVIDSTFTSLATVATGLNPQVGNKFGMRVTGTGTAVMLRCYMDTGSGWAKVGSDVFDSDGARITAAGPIGVSIGGTTSTLWRLDDFGGGTFVPRNAENTQAIAEVEVETLVNSADSTQSILSAEAESGGSSGGGSQSTSEATAESVLGTEIEGTAEEIAADDFNRANEDLGNDNPNWAVIEGEYEIISNEAYPTNRSADIGVIWTGDTFDNDQYSEARFYDLDPTGNPATGVGLTVRGGGPSIAPNTYYRLSITANYGGSGNFHLGKFVNTSFSDVTSPWRMATIVDGDLVRLEVEGTTLRLFLNGVQVGADWTDASIPDGYPGLAHSSPSTSGYLDDWSAGNMGSPAGNAENIQEIDELIAVVDTLTNTGAATIVITDAQSEAEVSTGTGAPAIAEATSESVLGSEIEYEEELSADNFNRANNADLGADWTPATPYGFTIAGNAAVPEDYSQVCAEGFVGDGVLTDQYSEVTVYGLHSGGFTGAGPGVIVRAGVLSAYTFVVTSVDGGEWDLAKWVGGVYTSLDSGADAMADGDVLRLEVEGTSIRAYRDGTLITAVTDSSLSSGYPGIAFVNFAFGGYVDDWSGGILATGNAENIQEISDYSVDAQGNIGAGSQSATDATAESPQNVGGPLDYGEGPYGGGPYGQGEPHTMAEALAETLTNSATNTPAIDEETEVGDEEDELTNVGVGTQAINEAEAGSEGGSGTNDPALSEATAESVLGTQTEWPLHVVNDDFNRANNTDLGTNWFEVGTGMQIFSNRISTTGVGIAFWAERKYTNVSFSATVGSVSGASKLFAMWRVAHAADRTQEPSGTGNWSGYYYQIDPSVDQIKLYRFAGPGSTQLGATFTIAGGIAAGTRVGITMVGNTITLYTYNSGVWTTEGTRTDSTYTTEGRVGLEPDDSGVSFDDFGVAAYVPNTTSTQKTSEAEAEAPLNSATATILISDFQTEEEVNTGTGAQTIAEALAEGASNTGTGTPAIGEEGVEPSMVSVATSTQSLSEAIVEPNIDNTATATHTLGVDATADTESNGGTGTHELSDYELDTTTNTGTGTPSQAEAVAEIDTVEFLASHFIDDDITIRVVPFSDISTGTWTVAPLYPKVDEIIALGGYPTESIRSGNNPNNDVAVMGLTPASDPGINTNHYINVEFFKDGDEVVDLVVKLKEGATVIATRTFSNVTETEEAPRQERIALTELEASAIVDYANLNIELVADQA